MWTRPTPAFAGAGLGQLLVAGEAARGLAGDGAGRIGRAVEVERRPEPLTGADRRKTG
jgi:hypothetical protein